LHVNPGRVKTDRRDAQKLVKALRMNDLSAVHVPEATDEAFRDLVHAWRDTSRFETGKATAEVVLTGARCALHWQSQLGRRASEMAIEVRLPATKFLARIPGAPTLHRKSPGAMRTSGGSSA
jgi:hypothetical protein